MAGPRGDSEQTRAEILAAARRLFAAQGLRSVTVRDVARAAGVTHGLVHHYFRTKERLIEEVLEGEITSAAEMVTNNPMTASPDSLAVVRRLLRYYLTEGRTSALLIARAELTGFEPEKMKPAGTVGPFEIMAERFAALQAETGLDRPHVDPTLASVYLGAAVFGLVTLHPWLMTAAGLSPQDYESRLDDLIEVGVAFVRLVAGLPEEQS